MVCQKKLWNTSCTTGLFPANEALESVCVNVDERIKLIYGEQYGVTIESELDEGTTATIIIPKLEETAEINSDESNKTKL